MMDLVTLVLACSLYADNSIPYAMIQTGGGNNPLQVSVDNITKRFKEESAATQYTQQQITQNKTVNIGLMQISSQWLTVFSVRPSELFRPCKNMVIATQIMNKLYLQCQRLAEHNAALNVQTCMLSLYKTGNAQTGLTYANQVIDYAAKHPFSVLAEKARDPGMLAAAEPQATA
jgi:type IV secretion system protein VirB1